jgi:hypothetical protein
VAQHLQPDHTRGDANTVGGYRAVHERPAAFEGADGFSYSVEVVAEHAAPPDGPWAAFLLFVRWARIGAASPMGHLESGYLAHAATEDDAVSALGAMRLGEARAVLDALIAERREGAAPQRRWWDAMRDDDAPADGAR